MVSGTNYLPPLRATTRHYTHQRPRTTDGHQTSANIHHPTTQPNLTKNRGWKIFGRSLHPPTPPPTLPALQNSQFFGFLQGGLFPRLVKGLVNGGILTKDFFREEDFWSAELTISRLFAPLLDATPTEDHGRTKNRGWKIFGRSLHPPTPPPTLPALHYTQFFGFLQGGLFPRLVKGLVNGGVLTRDFFREGPFMGAGG